MVRLQLRRRVLARGGGITEGYVGEPGKDGAVGETAGVYVTVVDPERELDSGLRAPREERTYEIKERARTVVGRESRERIWLSHLTV
jgi:hypothetical protein